MGRKALAETWSCRCCKKYSAGTYYVQCKPGCLARLVLKAGATDAWRDIGWITIPEGRYAIYCKTGGGTGQPCDVWIAKVADGEDCPEGCDDDCDDE